MILLGIGEQEPLSHFLVKTNIDDLQRLGQVLHQGHLHLHLLHAFDLFRLQKILLEGVFEH